MSEIARPAGATRPVLWKIPGLGWWAILFLVLAIGVLTGNWIVAGGVLTVILVQRARPLDFLSTSLLVIFGAAFVAYEAGQLTYQLTLLLMGSLFMLLCYSVPRGLPTWILHRTPLTIPLLAYLVLTLANFVRGILLGNAVNYAGLELVAVFALATSLLHANRLTERRDIQIASFALLALGFAQSIFGLYTFSVVRVRIGGVYFTPLPGLVALLCVNMALRAPRLQTSLLWLAASTLLVLHQFLSFTRGYWLGMFAGLAFTFVTYGGRGKGAGQRWSQVGLMLSLLFGFGVFGVIVLAAKFGIEGIFKSAATRLGSSLGTTYGKETASNVVRLVEYFTALGHVAKSPFIGQGLGFSFIVREPIGFTLIKQWYVHENYLLVLLKQGLVGLSIFVWMIVSAVVTGARSSRNPDPWWGAWCGTAAAATVFLAVASLSHFPFSEVTCTFLLALLWGGAMRAGSRGEIRFGWRESRQS